MYSQNPGLVSYCMHPEYGEWEIFTKITEFYYEMCVNLDKNMTASVVTLAAHTQTEKVDIKERELWTRRECEISDGLLD